MSRRDIIFNLFKKSSDDIKLQKLYHFTDKKNIDKILSDGLIINSSANLTKAGDWAHKIYGVNPIFLAFSINNRFNLNEYSILEVEVNINDLVADLPSLIDCGAYVGDIDNSNDCEIYWIDDIPKELNSHCTEDSCEFMASDFLQDKELIKAAMKVTDTAASLRSINSNKIKLIKR